jgi:hypothetical protein
MSDLNSVKIWTDTCEPRQTQNKVDIEYFSLKPKIEFESGPRNKFAKKILNWNLICGLRATDKRVSRFLVALSSWLGSIYFSARSFSAIRLVPGIGSGFFNRKRVSQKSLLNGYFQSEYWAKKQDVFEQLMKLEIKSPSKNLVNWISQIQNDQPIIVHIRLGDYRSEEKIGILNPDYFIRALNNEKLQKTSKKVWIFSDEPAAIDTKTFVPDFYQTRVFEDMTLNPAETLELMRHGSAYVISNSTFSWWGAYLSYNRYCPRFMPDPWFKAQESPVGIRPLEWNVINDPF